MERIRQESLFSRTTILILISRVLERISHYAFLAILIHFVTGNELQMNRQDAVTLYGWVVSFMVLFQIFGALASDLKLGNKYGVFLGGPVQALGALILATSTQSGLYIGLAFYLIGQGLYTPNIIALYGKEFLLRSKLLDAGFILFILMQRIVGGISSSIANFALDYIPFSTAYIAIGIVTMASLISVLWIQETTQLAFTKSVVGMKTRFYILLALFCLIGLFWAVKEIGDLGLDFKTTFNVMESLKSLFGFLALILAVIVWSFFYYNQFQKLAIGFVLTALGFGLLILLPEEGSNQYFVIMVISLLLLAAGEVHVSPILLSAATKFSNPKYLATTISLGMLPMTGLSYLSMLATIGPENNIMRAFSVGTVILGLLGLGIFLSLNSKLGDTIK